ncbi:MAG TPA: hypothetical protein VFC67_05090 [Prolixibacteraceae bacterium]|nr:hypothetical protein [Prolixibacteraceae bacterium]
MMILISDLLYQFWRIDDFNQPFTPDQNFGSWFDLALTGSLSGGIWVSFNAIPTTANTIWGIIAGVILMMNGNHAKRFKRWQMQGYSVRLLDTV